MRFIGRRSHPVPPELIQRMEWAEETTRHNDRITLFVAFNYGGRAEILDAARTFTGSTEDEFRAHLYAPEMHDPDLIIRTSGEQRLSNYLLWQSAYSELVFRDELWPDFSRRRSRRASRSSPHAGAASGAADAASSPADIGTAPATQTGPSEPPPHSRAAAAATRRLGSARTCLGGSSSRFRPRSSRSSSSTSAGLAWALFMIAIGWICLHELYRMLGRWRPVPVVGFAALAGMVLAAQVRRSA